VVVEEVLAELRLVEMVVLVAAVLMELLAEQVQVVKVSLVGLDLHRKHQLVLVAVAVLVQ
jgi:hypothetical protein